MSEPLILIVPLASHLGNLALALRRDVFVGEQHVPVEEEFERSPAFAWLKRHASRFGFRLSYPRRNRHGMAYEPWHWCWHARKR